MDSDHSENPLRELFESEDIYSLLEQYISLCSPCADDGGEAPPDRNSQKSKTKKQNPRSGFPNLAGFCRFLKVGTEELEELCDNYPGAYGRIMAVLEDEALNSDLSPTLISAYLKRRIGYDGSPVRTASAEGQLSIRFEHDIFNDGE